MIDGAKLDGLVWWEEEEEEDCDGDGDGDRHKERNKIEGIESRPRKAMNEYQVRATEEAGKDNETKERQRR